MSNVWDIEVKPPRGVKSALLHQEASAVLKGVVGVSAGPNSVRIHIDHQPTTQEMELAQGVALKHNPNATTPEEDALTRWEARLDALTAKDWSALTAIEREEFMRTLHEREAWLRHKRLPPKSGLM